MPDRTPVVFIHGLWVHPDSWKRWIDLFDEAGYESSAPYWPHEAGMTVEQMRADSGELAGFGATEITDHFAALIRELPAKPIVIGHSFGGVIVQKLLEQGDAVAGIAIDPGQIKGVKALPIAQLRSGFPALHNPANRKRAVPLTADQFHYGFGNALSREESDELYERWIVPGPGQVAFEVGFANFTPHSPLDIDTRKSDRGPLLFIAGGSDHAAPKAVVEGAYHLYRKSEAVTDFHEFPDRGHSIVFDHGWGEVAQYSLDWLSQQGL
jgi:non-heme chloroperoxidase